MRDTKCMYVCVFVCAYVWLVICVGVHMPGPEFVFVCAYVCVCVCVCVCVFAPGHMCVHACVLLKMQGIRSV